jgi:hypothetical protein
MTAAEPGRPEHSLLVCIYYRVAAGDAERAISAVREFQRTLHGHVGLIDAQVLLRCGLPNDAAAPDPVSLRPSAPFSDAPAAHQPPTSGTTPPAPDTDATLMETYRLALPAPAGSLDADAAVRMFLAALDACAGAVTGFLRSTRHIELFAPCAS